MIAVNTSAITTQTGVIAKGARLYVTNYGSGTVSVIDVSNPLAPKLVDTNPATPTTIDAIKVGSNPRGIAFAQTANGPRLYVANRGSGSVSVIDAVTNKAIDANPATTTTVDAITVGSTPQQIAISPDGKTAYVTNYGSNTVSIIDTVTNKVVDAKPATTAVDAVAVRANPNGVAVSADGTLRVTVANGDDRISVIDTKTKTVVNTIQIDTQTENNAHVLAVRADGSLMVTDLADRALRRVTYQRGNTAPVALAAPTVEEPNATGVVSGFDQPQRLRRRSAVLHHRERTDQRLGELRRGHRKVHLHPHPGRPRCRGPKPRPHRHLHHPRHQYIHRIDHHHKHHRHSVTDTGKQSRTAGGHAIGR